MSFKKIFLALSLFLLSNSNAQLANYLFENNLNDTVSNSNPVLLNSGVETTNSANFVAGSSGQSVLLSPLQGLKFPLSLSNQIDTNKSLEIEFKFTLTDIGDGVGYMALISNQGGVNDSGITIFTRHDVFSSKKDYEVVFSYADGGFNLGVPDHPGHDETRIGVFNEGDEVQLKLIIDFENKQWFSLLNDVYTSAPIDAFYDYSLIKKSFVEKEIYMSWYPGMEQDIPFTTKFFTSTVAFDNFALYSPKQSGNQGIFVNAVQAMTSHVNGSQTLTSSELDKNLADVQLNFDFDFSSVKQVIFDYVNAYETAKDPVFNSRNIVSISSLPAESQLLILLQQYIHDKQFIPSNISSMAGVKFEFASVFPGNVEQNAPRINNASVEINGSYKIIKAGRVVDDLAAAKRPTGYYAPAGELISITIPSNLIDKGLSAMIGAHDSDHSTLTHTNRFVRISKDFPLNNVTTLVANPFGGGIYIRVPEGLDLGWFNIQIDKAVKSAYFSYRTNRNTPLGEWQTQLLNKDTQWVDIESDKYMLTVPLKHVESITDPSSLMRQWNDIMDAYNYVGGRSPDRTRSEYFLVDSRLPSDAFGVGYPQVIGDPKAPNGILNSIQLYPTQILKPNFHDSGFHITLHELGHGALQPTIISETESIIHVNATYIYNVLYGLILDTAFKFSSGENHTLDETKIDWMIADNFRNNKPMSCDPTMDVFVCDEIRYQHRGHAKYIEMVELFGWQSVFKMNKYFVDIWNNDQTGKQLIPTPDLVNKAASLATGFNMSPLMHFWGLQPSQAMRAELSNMPESLAVKSKLEKYKSLVPNSKQDFQPWYDINFPKKDPVHQKRYNAALNNYDSEKYGNAMKNQIDLILDLYFSNLPDLIMKNGFESANN